MGEAKRKMEARTLDPSVPDDVAWDAACILAAMNARPEAQPDGEGVSKDEIEIEAREYGLGRWELINKALTCLAVLRGRQTMKILQ